MKGPVNSNKQEYVSKRYDADVGQNEDPDEQSYGIQKNMKSEPPDTLRFLCSYFIGLKEIVANPVNKQYGDGGKHSQIKLNQF